MPRPPRPPAPPPSTVAVKCSQLPGGGTPAAGTKLPGQWPVAMSAISADRPRMMVNAAQLPAVRVTIASDPSLSAIMGEITRSAAAHLATTAPVLPFYVSDGTGSTAFVDATRKIAQRTYSFSALYLLTGNATYATTLMVELHNEPLSAPTWLSW
jgi:hypothetical protein